MLLCHFVVILNFSSLQMIVFVLNLPLSPDPVSVSNALTTLYRVAAIDPGICTIKSANKWLRSLSGSAIQQNVNRIGSTQGIRCCIEFGVVLQCKNTLK